MRLAATSTVTLTARQVPFPWLERLLRFVFEASVTRVMMTMFGFYAPKEATLPRTLVEVECVQCAVPLPSFSHSPVSAGRLQPSKPKRLRGGARRHPWT